MPPSPAQYHIRKIRHFLDVSSTKALVQALVLSRIDYCNALLVNVPLRLSSKLQRLMNAAARVISRKKSWQHITPTLKQFHWLPVIARIKFKVLMMTYKCLNGSAPLYLQSLLKMYSSSRLLRSNVVLEGTLRVNRYKRKKHGGRAFSNIAPVLWNSIPQEIQNAETLATFKKRLKTHLFQTYYRC